MVVSLSTPERRPTVNKTHPKNIMDSTTKENKLTMSSVSDALDIGPRSSIVPPGLGSSSDQGQSELLASGNSVDLATGEVLMSQDTSREQEEKIGISSIIEDSPRSDEQKEQMEQMDIEKDALKRKRTTDSDEDELSVSSASLLARKQRIITDDPDPEEFKGTENLSLEPAIYISGEDVTDNKSVVSLYEEGVYVGDEEDGDHKKKKRGRGRPKKERRKVVGVQDLDVHELSDSEDSEGFNATSAAEAGARALEYLENVDQIRIKSRNIKVNLSNVMKRLKDSKEIIRDLMRKAEERR